MVTDRSHDHGASGVTLSSIALLQERFRQLQKMKELRQERELLRTLSESERGHSPPIPHVNSSSQFLQQTAFPGNNQLKGLPPKPQCQLSLSLWPDSHGENNNHAGSRELRKRGDPSSSDHSKSWHNTSDSTQQRVCTAASPVKLERRAASDIDTSLRL